MSKKEVDCFTKESGHIPTCRASVSAGRTADALFHCEVAVRGSEEDLSFNIMIPLPTQPEHFQKQGIFCIVSEINVTI